MSAALHVFQLFAAILLMGCESERPAARSASAPEPQQQAQQAPRAGASRPSLCLELEGPRRPVLLGEPVTLIASVVNCSSQVQQVHDLLSPDFGFLQLWLQPSAGPETLLKPVTYRDARGKQVRSLAPGERISAFAPVYFGIGGWTITQPGTYRARAAFSTDSGTLQSKPIEFAVQPPETPADRQAAELMMSREVGLFLVTGVDEGGKGSDRLATLEQQYAQSRLAPYARLARAVAATRNSFDPKTKTFRKDGCDRAAEPLGRAIPQIADPLLATRGTSALIGCLRDSGQGAEANRAVSMLLRSHPGASEVPAVLQLKGSARKE